MLTTDKDIIPPHRAQTSCNRVSSAQFYISIRDRTKKARKKRRQLEAARETMKIRWTVPYQSEESGGNKKDGSGISLVDLAYRRGKAVKAGKKAQDVGRMIGKTKSPSRPPPCMRLNPRQKRCARTIKYVK